MARPYSMARWAIATAAGWALVLHVLLMAALPGAQAAALPPGEAQLTAALQIICSAHDPFGPQDPAGDGTHIHASVCVLCSTGLATLPTTPPALFLPQGAMLHARAVLPPASGPPAPFITENARSRAPPRLA